MTTQNTTNQPLPLYKRLNEERTQGEWVHGWGNGITGPTTPNMNPFVSKRKIDIVSLGKCTICCFPLPENESTKQMTANAQFTALAVNNLAALAEALEGVISRLATFTESNAWEQEDQDALDIAEAALARIS